MTHSARSLALAVETHEFNVVQVIPRHSFYRDIPIENVVMRGVNGSHAALSEPTMDMVSLDESFSG
jgi:hypothetical protein